jgi:predicted ATPase/serine phosphatase RsbU (regulator of sigma subunit)/tRNA A-37 threonylcarbamoyl transferase component Bud32
MLEIDGYQILTQIYESNKSLIYQGIRTQDNCPVILKMLKQDYPNLAELNRYKQEYQISCNLNFAGVINAYDIKEYKKTLVIIFEDFGGTSLKLQIKKLRKLQSSEFFQKFLNIAIQIADILGQIHAAKIIHKDINPANIIFNSKTGQVKIIDFGIATILTSENPTLKSPNALEGTLAYISPEQTGRMNRILDYRTDFYSLGVTFYELLTGKLPFTTTDLLELVHCHIAKQPIPPHQINSEIPQVLSEIVMKLMAKTAEDRYQSAWGLKADLENCFSQLQSQGQINYFPLATQDTSAQFSIPQKLYGREKEVAALLTAFERVAGDSRNSQPEPQPEMMLIAGYSGIGKSVLVQEIYKPITQKRGYFISGKFDQFQRNIPYSAVLNAFEQLIKQILTETEENLKEWREKILKALGINGQVIIDVLPELELIIGKQHPLSDLSAVETLNRFNLVFQNFIQVFTTLDHPLVLFLDDLQWADSGSLQLMQFLMSSRRTGLFLICAYRDNEVSSGHPFILTLEEIQKNGAIINRIFLSPLSLPIVTQIIIDSFKSAQEEVHALAELIFIKTGGNPFFIKELLQALYTEKLLEFNFTSQRWEWDLAEINAKGFTDNVVELMAAKIEKLPEKTQEILKIAACIGNQFDINTLSLIAEKSWREVNQEIHASVTNGLVLIRGTQKEVELAVIAQELNHESGVNINDSYPEYQFVHDRIQQAAYSLIPPINKPILHHKIGQIWLINTPIEKRELEIFNIVNQLNFSIDLITNQSEKYEMAQLNIIAGKRAKLSAAYQAALTYFKCGIKLLSPDRWYEQYDLTLSLYTEAAEAEYLCGHFDEMETLVKEILANTEKILDQVKAYEVKIQAQFAQNQLQEAINTGIRVLKLLDVNLPQQATKLNLLLNVLPTNFTLKKTTFEELVNLPEMTDAKKLASIRILNLIILQAYLIKPHLVPILVAEGVKLSIKYGNANVSPVIYAFYGSICCGKLDIETGYKFGSFALNLLEKTSTFEIKAKTLLLNNIFIKHWKNHLIETLKDFQEVYQIGLETGDIESATVAIQAYCAHAYLIGQELQEISEKTLVYNKIIRQFQQEYLLDSHEIYQQTVINLLKDVEDPCVLVGEFYDETIRVNLAEANNNRTALLEFYLNKLILYYLFGDFNKALEFAEIAAKDIPNVQGLVYPPFFYFYDCLIRLALYEKVSKSQKNNFLRRVKSHLKKLQKWADYAPMNYGHKVDVVEAELYRVQGLDELARKKYIQAIELGKTNGYINEVAITYELAANFYLSQKDELIAKVYIEESRYFYQLWGAKSKVKDLETKYPQFLSKSATANHSINSTVTPTTTTTTTSSGVALDLLSVVKASQAIGSEIVLEGLLRKLMEILIANAGAEIGYLILEKQGQLFIEAEGAIDTDNIAILQSVPIAKRLPNTIINYVMRTGEFVVLNNATLDNNFKNDVYIIEYQPKSILCFPLMNQGKLISIVYLENKLIPDAFTPERLEILKILSSQAAISIENAQLYQNLEDKVIERTAQLQQANQEISLLNEKLQEENLRLGAELQVAKKLQQMVLPKLEELQAIDNLEIACFMQPADEVGGDYYDIIQKDGKVNITIGDVTGHGLESGVVMIMTQTAVRTLYESNKIDSGEFIDILNRTIYQNVQRINPYKNLTFARLEYSDNILRVSGQHEEVIVVRQDGKIEKIDTTFLGLPLGLEEEIGEFIGEETIKLNSGDVVVLYTDGITEAVNLNEKQYQLENLCNVVYENREKSAEEIKQAVINDVQKYIGEQKVFDDLTLVVLKQK